MVLDGISFELPAGGTLAVLGRNGVGKTTLLATLMGFTNRHSGAIRFAGRRARDRGRIAATGWGSAMCRRSAKFFPR